MSDMYLVLRRRLDDVARQHDWVPIGTETMRDARKHLGLSYEAVGRALSVASKTYERWEKAGEVPRQDVQRVADALGLVIEQAEQATVTVEPTTRAATLAEIAARMDEALANQQGMWKVLGSNTEALEAVRASLAAIAANLEARDTPARSRRSGR
jgi:transcriptional regulator with XRE-family HTH domain